MNLTIEEKMETCNCNQPKLGGYILGKTWGAHNEPDKIWYCKNCDKRFSDIACLKICTGLKPGDAVEKGDGTKIVYLGSKSGLSVVDKDGVEIKRSARPAKAQLEAILLKIAMQL